MARLPVLAATLVGATLLVAPALSTAADEAPIKHPTLELLRRDLDRDGVGDHIVIVRLRRGGRLTEWIVAESGVTGQRLVHERRDTVVSPDLTGDGLVDGADVGAMLSAFGVPLEPDLPWADADLNRDGRVDGADLGALLQAFGGAAPTGGVFRTPLSPVPLELQFNPFCPDDVPFSDGDGDCVGVTDNDGELDPDDSGDPGDGAGR